MHSPPGASPVAVSLSLTGRNRWCLTGAALRGLTEVLRREDAECGQTARTAADPRTSRSQRLMRPTAGKRAGRYNRPHYSGSVNNPIAFSYRLFQKHSCGIFQKRGQYKAAQEQEERIFRQLRQEDLEQHGTETVDRA